MTMARANPLADDAPTDPEDQALVARARSGERQALEALVGRHQAWIYNIAVRMLYHPPDAEDATQEILVKALTGLASFEGRSSFRTWLYRIVVNHVLNIKRGRREPEALTFGCYAHALDATPDLDPPDERTVPVDVRLLVDEARISCTAGMLLCLDREQRLTYILGEIFEVSDTIGAELLEISRENVRQRLARARRDLHSLMNGRCGLVNRSNPCRCAKKTRGFMQAGYVDPESLLFAREHVEQVHEVARARAEALTTLDAQYAAVFRRHPFHQPRDLVPALRRLLAGPDISQVTDSCPSPKPDPAAKWLICRPGPTTISSRDHAPTPSAPAPPLSRRRHPPARPRELGPAPATRRLQANGTPAEAPCAGPPVVGRAGQRLDWLEAGSGHRVARHRSCDGSADASARTGPSSRVGPPAAALPSMPRSPLSSGKLPRRIPCGGLPA